MPPATPDFEPEGAKDAKDSDVVGLSAGDLIYLERADEEFGVISGVIYGDANLSTCGVEGKQNTKSSRNRTGAVAGDGPWRFNECVFRLVSKLDYRARDEHRRLVAAYDAKEVTNGYAFQGSSRMTDAAHNLTKQEAPSSPALKEKKGYIPGELELAKQRSDLEARENTAARIRMSHGQGIQIRYGST